MDNSTPEKFLDVDKVLRQKSGKSYRFVPKFLIRYLERITHQDELNEILFRLKGVNSFEFLHEILFNMFGVEIEYHGLENIPKEGGIIIAGNHPLGGMDGMALMHVVGKVRTDIKFVANDLLLHLPNLRDLFVAVNKLGGNSQESVLGLNQVLNSDQALLIFPAGLVSRKQQGGISDLEWKKTFISKAVAHKRDVVPVYINGRNSDFFYNLARLRKLLNIKLNIEMLYLVDEMFKQRNKKITLTFGKPISHTTFTSAFTPHQWAGKVRRYVYSLPQGNQIFNF